jgi:DNA polymerase III subunit gamma/tau
VGREPIGFGAGPAIRVESAGVQNGGAAAAPSAAPAMEMASAAQTLATPVAGAGMVRAGFGAATEMMTEGALTKAPETVPAGGADVEAMRTAVVGALGAAGHNSAALLLGTGEWRLEGTTLRIEVPGIKKKMLELTVSAAAEKIIRQELQRLGAPARFMVTPGEGSAVTSGTAPVAAGSVQEAALQHPLVKKAQEIFKAEVRGVVDLRQK